MSVAGNLHLAVFKALYHCHIDEFYTIFFHVIDQMAAVRGAGPIHKVRQHFYHSNIHIFFKRQPVGSFAANHTSSDNYNLLCLSQQLRILQQFCCLCSLHIFIAWDIKFCCFGADGGHDRIIAFLLQGIQITFCIKKNIDHAFFGRFYHCCFHIHSVVVKVKFSLRC
ncbi:hypothetical protein DSECCO2_375400 [anaerobic digester metagenome]